MIRRFLAATGRILLAIVTEADNRTPSAFRVSALVVTAHMMALSFHATVTANLGFDASSFGMGIAAVWAAAGIGERVAAYGMGAN